MRICVFIHLLTFLAALSLAAYAAGGEDAGNVLVYETTQFRFIIPEGWEANEIEPDAYRALEAFDGKLLRPPLGIVAGDSTAGLMMLSSGRKDRANTLFDYMLLQQWAKLEIYVLFDGEYEFVDANGTERKCNLSINAVDDGQSTVLISHNLVFLVGDIRYEFAYIADADEYAVNFAEVEDILSSIEFY